MQYKQPKFYWVILPFLLFTNTIVSAAEGTSFTRLHKGTVLSISADKLVTEGLFGKKKNHTYDVAPTATISCEGRPCKLTDIKIGEHVLVTTEKSPDGKAAVIKVEAKRTEG